MCLHQYCTGMQRIVGTSMLHPFLLVFYSQLVMMISTICGFLQVCLYRSWTTVRVMKAEQRAELLKRIKDQQGKKLSFQECREIAKDLNLSLEQVKQIA